MDDEWVELSNRKHKPIRKRVKLCNLPEEAKSKINEKLFGVTPPSSQITSENNENFETCSKLGDTSWIKSEEYDNESKFPITPSPEENSCQTVQASKAKQSRKNKSSQRQDTDYRSPLYSLNYLKPPKGLF